MEDRNHATMAEHFGWTHHPFTDIRPPAAPYLTKQDKRIIDQALSLLSYGKSVAVTGPSGAGKSTLIQHLVARLDQNYYKPAFIHYGGLNRSGLLRAVAFKLDVETAGRSVPLLIKLQNHIASIISSASPVYPVIIIDDAQHLEKESLSDLCSLIVSPPHKTAAASLVIVGDETLTQRLELAVMTQIKTRFTVNLKIKPLDEIQTGNFIAHRLEQAKGPKDLFEPDAIPLVAAHCRGNKRKIMNTGTILLDEAFYRKENTISAQLLAGCDLLT